MAPEPSPRAIGTERGCVEDQPQRVGSSKASGACRVLRLVEDDTAALRFTLFARPLLIRTPPQDFGDLMRPCGVALEPSGVR